MGNYSLSFSRNDALCGIELTLQQPKETGYVTLKTTNTIQSNDSYFKITDIISQKNTERISGEFVATLNNGEKIKGSFRMTVPKPTIN
jgi:calcineurin-like phosphoesterase family protein